MLIGFFVFLAALTGVLCWATERVDGPKRRAERLAEIEARRAGLQPAE